MCFVFLIILLIYRSVIYLVYEDFFYILDDSEEYVIYRNLFFYLRKIVYCLSLFSCGLNNRYIKVNVFRLMVLFIYWEIE